jgi:1-acyl-sn-glycerol-3-phosphate acyltransferase
VTDEAPRREPTLRAVPGRSDRGGRDPQGKRALFTTVEPRKAEEDLAGDSLLEPHPIEVPVDLAPGVTEAHAEIREPIETTRREVLPATRRFEPVIEGERRSDVDHWGRSEHMREVARRVYDPMYRHWFRAEWEGMEHIPRHGGALLVSNHAGAIPSDAPVIMHGIEQELGRPVYGMAEHLFKALPWIGTAWQRLGGVAAHPDNAYRLLHDEQQLALVFPEGTKGTGKRYSDRYRLARFGRGGFVQIAMQAGVPIVPIAVVGAEESMPILFKMRRTAKLLNVPYVPITANMLMFGPLGALLYLPAKFRLRVLPPIHFEEPADQERYSRSRVMEASEQIRQQIQEALYDMLRERTSVWFG